MSLVYWDDIDDRNFDIADADTDDVKGDGVGDGINSSAE